MCRHRAARPNLPVAYAKTLPLVAAKAIVSSATLFVQWLWLLFCCDFRPLHSCTAHRRQHTSLNVCLPSSHLQLNGLNWNPHWPP